MRGGLKQRSILSSRGQAAMEFLMTYGWALLVVILAIASLSFYFGFGNNLFVTETCLMGPGFACVDFVVDEGSITIAVLNGLGDDLISFYFSHPACSVQSASLSLKNGQKKLFTVTGCEGVFTEGDFVEDAPTFAYKTIDSSIEHTKAFSLSAIVAGGTSQSFGGGSDDGNGFAPGDGDGYMPTGTTVALYKFDDGSGITLSDSLGSSPGTLQNFDPSYALYHFDEGNGDATADSSGNGYNGDLGATESVCPAGVDITRCPEWSSGISGGGLYFDGDTDASTSDFTDRGDFVDIGASTADFSSNDKFTLSSWIKLSDNPYGSGHTVFGRRKYEMHYQLYLDDGLPPRARFIDTDGVSLFSYWADPFNFYDGNWHHIGVVINGSGVTGSQIYIDGQPSGASFSPAMFNGGHGWISQIGAWNGGNGWQGTYGNMDEFVIYDTPLSTAQMEYLFEQQQALDEPYWINGAYSGGLHFDGVDDTVTIADNFVVGDYVTTEAWVYPLTTYNQFFLKKGGNEMRIFGGNFHVAYNIANATATKTVDCNFGGGGAVTPDQWQQVVGQFNGSGISGYLNGQLVKTCPYNGTLNFQPGTNMYLGSTGSGQFFKGIIDEVRISDGPIYT